MDTQKIINLNDVKKLVRRAQKSEHGKELLFDATAHHKGLAEACFESEEILRIQFRGMMLAHHIVTYWEDSGTVLLNNKQFWPILSLNNDEGSTVLHMMCRSETSRKKIIATNNSLLKISNPNNGLSIAHMLAYDNYTAQILGHGWKYIKLLYLREKINGATVAHWIGKHSINGTYELIKNRNNPQNPHSGAYQFILNQRDNRGNSVMDTIRMRWSSNFMLNEELNKI